MLTELTGQDALNVDCDAIAHGVNMKGSMAGGIARQIAQMYPLAEKDYIQYCEQGFCRLGGCLPFPVNVGKPQGPYTIYNLFTQIMPGRDARLSALDVSLKRMNEHALENDIQKIVMPQIGCGIGGLNWEDVKPILESNSEGLLYVVCTL
jgi:O-acetyl-ADP-ribose deacetylase (regulator of RNase III)